MFKFNTLIVLIAFGLFVSGCTLMPTINLQQGEPEVEMTTENRYSGKNFEWVKEVQVSEGDAFDSDKALSAATQRIVKIAKEQKATFVHIYDQNLTYDFILRPRVSLKANLYRKVQ